MMNLIIDDDFKIERIHYVHRRIMGAMIWDLVVAAGRTEVFMDPNWSRDDWILWLIRQPYLFVAVYRDRIAGFVVIMHHRPHRAEAAWCALPAAGRYILTGGRIMVSHIMKDLNVKVLYGFTPKKNKLAVKYSIKIGGEVTGILPLGSYRKEQGVDVDAYLISFFNKES